MTIADSFADGTLQPMSAAPKDATEILAATRDRHGNRRWVVIHWAQGGGEEQPRFVGWFYWCGDGYAEVRVEMVGWIHLPDVDACMKAGVG